MASEAQGLGTKQNWQIRDPWRLSVRHDTGEGTLRAHDLRIYPQAMRATEISTAGQLTREPHQPRSCGPEHKTRPIGRGFDETTLRAGPAGQKKYVLGAF